MFSTNHFIRSLPLLARSGDTPPPIRQLRAAQRGNFLPFFQFFPKGLPYRPDLLFVRGKKLPH
jgi:hypothetical protein|tara:strand:- start:583 stop:771 length:189 start_codon:yes stop_codon:yes gene_type:complete